MTMCHLTPPLLLGVGGRRFTRAQAEYLRTDDAWAKEQCAEFGIKPTVMNKLMLLIARSQSK